MAGRRAIRAVAERQAVKLRGAAVVALAAAFVAACASPYQAPVVERPVTRPGATKPAAPAAAPSAVPAERRPESYAVRRGDTLYSIALDNGLDYRELAAWNNLADPAQLQTGQVLRMRPPEIAAQPQAPVRAEGEVRVQPATIPGAVETRPLGGDARPAAAEARPPAEPARPVDLKTAPKAMKLPYSVENLAMLLRLQPPAVPRAEVPGAGPPPAQKPDGTAEDSEGVAWMWPAAGRVLAGFSEATNKGLDIVGKIGDPVFASAGGRVVYSGVGLRGYGKLVIIKHNQTYLSAYAHNSNILVKEGQNVARGQKIAEIGNTDAPQVKLHFEIRRLGKPVDPMKFLPERPS
jgi:lipoprotein NlpD